MAEQPTNTWVKWEVGVPSDALSSYKDQFWELIYWGGVDPSCTYQEPRGGIDVTILKTEQYEHLGKLRPRLYPLFA